MKLTASLIVRDELSRYLEACIGHLLEFVDEIRVLDDGSTDGSGIWLAAYDDRIHLTHLLDESFFGHEGRARQALLDWTLEGEPTHVLSIDADEFVADGAAVRAACEGAGEAWTLEMQEVWKAFDECLCLRWDGGWRPHPVPILWRVPDKPTPDFRIRDAALACGREPVSVRRLAQMRQAAGPITEVLHFGWASASERVARHERYVVADGGRFHAHAHLQSILHPEERVEMDSRDWPAGLEPFRAQILDYVGLAA